MMYDNRLCVIEDLIRKDSICYFNIALTSAPFFSDAVLEFLDLEEAAESRRNQAISPTYSFSSVAVVQTLGSYGKHWCFCVRRIASMLLTRADESTTGKHGGPCVLSRLAWVGVP